MPSTMTHSRWTSRQLLALGSPSDHLPKRVRDLIAAQELKSERLIGWVQLSLAAVFAVLYAIAPRPSDVSTSMLSPVPLALALYASFTFLRLWLAYFRTLPGWLLAASILIDTALLLGLIWSFHAQYNQPAAFSLKVPTFIYVIVFIALRALRFDHRYVLTAGLATALGWMSLVAAVLYLSPPGTVTRSFADYVTGRSILIGAEVDKVLAVLMTTTILTLVVYRARHILVTAVREEAAGREIRRFLSDGVADTITRSEAEVRAGQAVERNAAILMLDIRGFTRFSMAVPPAEVVEVLTSFHARVIPVIKSNGGVIDKFLGDGVMATFGAVTPSESSAADAVRALEALLKATADWQQNLSYPSAAHLEVNAAVAAGRVVFAAIGNEERLEYTVIGDAANLAAKLEKHNKVERTRAVVAASTYDLAVAQGFVPVETPKWRHSATVSGVAEPLEIIAF